MKYLQFYEILETACSSIKKPAIYINNGLDITTLSDGALHNRVMNDVKKHHIHNGNEDVLNELLTWIIIGGLFIFEHNTDAEVREFFDTVFDNEETNSSALYASLYDRVTGKCIHENT